MAKIRCPHCAGTIELLGSAQAAEQLGVDPSHVRRLAEARRLVGVKVGSSWVFVAPVERPASGPRGNPNQCDRCGQFASVTWIVENEGRWCDSCIEEVEEEMKAGEAE